METALAAIYTFGEPFIAELIPLREAQKHTDEDLYAPRYEASMPDGKLEEAGIVPIWVTGNGDIFIKGESDYSNYLTSATVHGEWKKKLHQRIAYAVKIYEPPMFDCYGNYLDSFERRELYELCIEAVKRANSFEEAVGIFRKLAGVATCVKCGREFYVSVNYKGSKPICPQCRMKG